MNRQDHLGEKIIWVLQQNDRLSVEAIAGVLYEKPKAVAVACLYLERRNIAVSIRPGGMVRNRHGRKKPECYWQLGQQENPPPMPPRGKRHDCMNVTIGITDDDLAWMEKYQQQRQRRLQRVDTSNVMASV